MLVAAEAIAGRPRSFRGVQGTAVCGLFGLTAALTGASEKSLRRAGRTDYERVYLHPGNHVGYYPGARPMYLKLLFARADGRVLGAQAVGAEGVEKRIDAIAVAIQNGATVYDLEEAELCYAPQFGAAKDPVNLAGMLAQKSRLASLGLAVSKINHDLRNLLTTAQLFSDRLARLTDPTVQRFAPKLVRALERAISFCESTLSYGRVQEPSPDRRMVALDPLVEEVRETLGLDADTPLRWVSSVERGLMVEADPDQLFRVLVNIARNAVQALESRAAADPGRDQVRITGRREGAVARSLTLAPGSRRRHARICSRRSRAQTAPAARGSGLRSRPSWCVPMAARSGLSRAPSGRPSGSPSRTAPSSCGRAATVRPTVSVTTPFSLTSSVVLWLVNLVRPRATTATRPRCPACWTSPSMSAPPSHRRGWLTG